MTRLSFAVAVGALVLAGSLAVAAQAPQGAPPQGGGAAQPPPQNLQVLPKDMARGQVLQIMQNFSAALGVTCNHCHVFVGPNDPMNDFAGDTKPTKNVARAMMRMVREINPSVQKSVPAKAADQVAQVGCATCHRGAAIPVVAPATPGAPPPPRGQVQVARPPPAAHHRPAVATNTALRHTAAPRHLCLNV
jgi:Photosynthetic reaction centre cytochrome C subunit